MRSALVLISLVLLGCPSSDPDCGPGSAALAPRAGAVSGWDAINGRLVVFGGDQGAVTDCVPQHAFLNQTLGFDPTCGGFVGVGGDTLPFARGGAAGATDPNGQTLYVHGGRHRPSGEGGAYSVFGDLWSLAFGADAWTELTSSGDPPGRFDHVVATTAGSVLVHGGNRATGADVDALDDLWRYDLLTGLWERLDVPGGPGARHGHAAVGLGQTLYVFGGAGPAAGELFADVWFADLSGATWTQLHDGAGGPSRRTGASLLLDEGRNRLLLFGGLDDGLLGHRNDLWAFDLSGRSWSLLAAGDTPGAGSGSGCDRDASVVVQDLDAPERRANASAGVSSDGALTVAGGRTECGLIDDVWRWTEAGWSRVVDASSGQSCARAGGSCDTVCP